MDKEQFLALIQKYLAGEATWEEEQLLLNFYGSFQDSDVWNEMTMGVKDEVEAKMLGRIQAGIAARKTIKTATIRLWPKIAVAAAAVAMVLFGVWFYIAPKGGHHPNDRRDLSNYAIHDIAPGKNGATITLASGEVIELNGAKKGVVIGNGLTYTDNTSVIGAPSGKVVGMTASTTKGQTYEFTLPDGTHVWLNADSKISFPNQFSGKERKILLSGEAYFAVAHNAKMPFRVESEGQVVEDIGTEFNINAYADESSIKTTLVEGIAKVNSVVLKPNQQATLLNNKISVKDADTEQALDWKNGKIVFNDESLESIMKRVARWYNVKVVYHGAVSDLTYGGAISRTQKISSVLRFFSRTGNVDIEIDGRTVTITRK